jgi:hypothetical protein
MTRDDIIRIAREAGVPNSWDLNWFDPTYDRFAELVAAAVMPKEALAEMFEWGKDAGRREEREACLSIAKSQIDNCFTLLSHPPKSSAAYKIQIAIEARSKPQPETLSPAELRRRTNAPWNDKASY